MANDYLDTTSYITHHICMHGHNYSPATLEYMILCHMHVLSLIVATKSLPCGYYFTCLYLNFVNLE